MSSESSARAARVTGTVQGVNYRRATQRKAQSLELNGWVRNTGDGAVELLVRGTLDAVEELLAWCWEGPSRASVSGVEARQPSEEELRALPETGFEVRR